MRSMGGVREVCSTEDERRDLKSPRAGRPREEDFQTKESIASLESIFNLAGIFLIF
jgi:hypothetical protein